MTQTDEMLFATEAQQIQQRADQSVEIATEKYLDKLVEARNIKLDEIEKTKEETFSLVKQSFWQKLVGSIVNKFYKAGKIKNSTIIFLY